MRDLGRLDALSASEAERELLDCCASPAWARAIVAGRPYRDLPSLREAAIGAARVLPWDEVHKALGGHARIGERPAGPGREASWSRREQSGVGAADESIRAALMATNVAYEQRFGHIFLIFATGRSAAEMLEAAEARLRHDEATERLIVREELAKIAALRLERWVTGGG